MKNYDFKIEVKSRAKIIIKPVVQMLFIRNFGMAFLLLIGILLPDPGCVEREYQQPRYRVTSLQDCDIHKKNIIMN
jgi:hypothetical protein